MKQWLCLFVLLLAPYIWYPLFSMEFLVQAKKIQEEPIALKPKVGPVNNAVSIADAKVNIKVSDILALFLEKNDAAGFKRITKKIFRQEKVVNKLADTEMSIEGSNLLTRYKVIIPPHKTIYKKVPKSSSKTTFFCNFPNCNRGYSSVTGLAYHKKTKHPEKSC